MASPVDLFASLSGWPRVAAVVLIAIGGHFVIRLVRILSEWIIEPAKTPGTIPRDLIARRHPKFATVASLSSSALTFAVYFLAIGLILSEFNVSLTAYLATASVFGLAVAFGAQGLVQDVVIGLTLVFSHTFDIGDVVEVSGQIGRVEAVGLRFIQIRNFLGQTIFIPNRTVGMVGRYRKGCVRAYIDLQAPAGVPEEKVRALVGETAEGVHAQFSAICVSPPEIFGIRTAGPSGWRYLRLRFRLWPGQNTLVESAFRQRLLAEIRKMDAGYPDWMITVTYRVD